MRAPAAIVLLLASACSRAEDARPDAGAAPPPVVAPRPQATATASPSATAPGAHAATHVPALQRPDVAASSASDKPIVLAWRPNGRAFAAAAGETVFLQPLRGRRVELPKQTRTIAAIAFSRAGDRLASVDAGGAVKVWHGSSGGLVADLPGEVRGTPGPVAFSADGKLVAAAGETATIWRVQRPQKLCSTEAAVMDDVAFTRDGRSLVTTGRGIMRRWDTASCAKKADKFAQTGGTFGSWVSPDGAHVAAAASEGHDLMIYDSFGFSPITQLARSSTCKDHIGPLSFSRDGSIVLASGSYRWFRSFRLAGKKTIASYDVPHADEVTGVVLFDDGQRLLVVRGDHGELVSARSREVAWTTNLFGATTFDVSSDMKHLAAASPREVRVYDTATGQVVATFPLG